MEQESSQKTFEIYKSSAGSGKTYTLAVKYITLLLRHRTDTFYFKKILSITFTNKAVQEMKDRIIVFLQNIALKENNWRELISSILENLDITEKENLSEDNIVEYSGEVLSCILHNYSDFPIMTIDSFFQRVVRSFAVFHDKYALNNTIILEEIDINMYLRYTFEHLLESENSAFFSNVIKFFSSNNRSVTNKSFLNIENKILKFLEHVVTNNISKKNIDSNDIERIKQTLRKDIQTYENRVEKVLSDIQYTEDIAEALPKNKGFVSFEKHLRNYKDVSGKTLEGLNKIFNLTEDNLFKKTHKNISSAQATFKQCIFGILDTDILPLIRDYEQYILNIFMSESIYLTFLIQEYIQGLEHIKQLNAINFIGDFEQFVQEIFENESLSFFYERLGVRYSHYLIDEAQDMSDIQWNNIIPLLDETLANGQYNMAVGDAKQAIYGWRGGDVRQFIDLHKKSNSIFYNSNIKKLEYNYRSKANIVQFNNAFFKTLLDSYEFTFDETYKAVYQDMEQEARKEGGYVRFVPPEEAEGYTILDIVSETKQKGYEYSDIAILCRDNECIKTVVDILKKENIPSVFKKSTQLSEHQEIQFLIAMMKCIFEVETIQDQYIVCAYILSIQQKSIDAHAKILKYKTQKHTIRVWDFIIDIFGEDFCFQDEKWKVSSYTTVCLLLEVFPSLLKYKHLEIATFKDTIYQYEAKHGFSPTAFIKYWEDNKHLFLLPSADKQAIQVLTVHQAKGLQFNICIVLEWNLTSSINKQGYFYLNDTGFDIDTLVIKSSKVLQNISKTEQQKKQEDNIKLFEELNILYVACTRPVEALYISTQMVKKSTLQNVFHLMEDTKSGVLQDKSYPICTPLSTEKTHTHHVSLNAHNVFYDMFDIQEDVFLPKVRPIKL